MASPEHENMSELQVDDMLPRRKESTVGFVTLNTSTIERMSEIRRKSKVTVMVEQLQLPEPEVSCTEWIRLNLQKGWKKASGLLFNSRDLNCCLLTNS